AATAAHPKIADYPFTTLHPGLGVVDLGTSTRFVLADIPGLIEGAAEGAGLGHRFLGHVERCKVLLHLIDVTQDDPAGAYRTIRNELAAYDPDLAARPEIVALNKIDALTPELVKEQMKLLKKAYKGKPLLLSGVSGEGVKAALYAIADKLGLTGDREETPPPSDDPDAEEGWSPL
ncbi:MAG: GTPase, partial [Hyphomonas sp.]|nr:GTPase [Hyphomonas sp.]